MNDTNLLIPNLRTHMCAYVHAYREIDLTSPKNFGKVRCLRVNDLIVVVRKYEDKFLTCTRLYRLD